MALSPIALCSHALMKIGAQPIQSFHDDTVEASLASAFFTPCRDALLSAYPWRFATAQASLPQLQDAPLTDYPFAFQLPTDCVRVLSIGSGNSSRGISYRRMAVAAIAPHAKALVTHGVSRLRQIDTGRIILRVAVVS